RVEKQAREAALRELAVAREISVLLVARDREAQVRQVNPDLVRSAGEKVRREQREVAQRLLAPEHGLRLASLAVHAHPALARFRQVLLERQVDAALLVAPAPEHERQIALAHPALAQRGMEPGQRRALLREN